MPNPKCATCGKALRQGFTYEERALTEAEQAIVAGLRERLDEARVAIEDEYEASPTMTYEQRSDKIGRVENRLQQSFRAEDGGALTTLQPGYRTPVRLSTPTGHFGPYGEGIFCSLRCGFDFGVVAHGVGYRLRTATP